MAKKHDIGITILEYDDKYIEALKELLVELQETLVKVDHSRTLIMNSDYRDKYYELVLKTTKENKGIIYLAKKDENVVGMIAGYIVPVDAEDKLINRCPIRGRISELIVTKNARGYGIGKQLIEKIEAFFKDNDCEFSRLIVLESNKRAKQLYDDMGYKPIELELSKNISK